MRITDIDVTRAAYQISEEYPEGLRNALTEYMDDHPGGMLIYGDKRRLLPDFLTGGRDVFTYTIYVQWGEVFHTISWTIDEDGEFSNKRPVHNSMTIHELEVFRQLAQWSGQDKE